MHSAEIPQKYIDRMLSRRPQPHIFTQVDLSRTALLVIDMQNGFVVPGYSLMEVPGLLDIVQNINRLADLCRRNGALVVWTQMTFTEEWRAWAENFSTPSVRARIIQETAEGSYGFQIHESLHVHHSDMRVTKRRSSAFIPGSSNLHEQLQRAGCETVIITGTLTNACCESTARDATQMNYNTLFVSDACGTRSDEEHQSTLINMALFYADVLNTEECAQLIMRSADGR